MGQVTFSVRRLSLPCFFLAKVAPREGNSMEQQVEEVTAEQPSEEPQERAECDLHIKIPNEMRGTLKGVAELWGMAIQKKKWLDRVGYR